MGEDDFGHFDHVDSAEVELYDITVMFTELDEAGNRIEVTFTDCTNFGPTMSGIILSFQDDVRYFPQVRIHEVHLKTRRVHLSPDGVTTT